MDVHVQAQLSANQIPESIFFVIIKVGVFPGAMEFYHSD